MYKTFVFETYSFDIKTKVLTLTYSLDAKLYFKETYTFDFDFVDYDEKALDTALQKLFFIAGVSYYKTYIPAEIIINTGNITEEEAEFYAKTYKKGLGEFWYVNQLNPLQAIQFPSNTSGDKQTYKHSGSGYLIAVGGGKDSIASIELLKQAGAVNLSTWSLNHAEQLRPLIERIGLPHFYVNRSIDEKLLIPGNLPGSYNGHIPVSAIFACVGTIVAILAGKKDIVMSNERSADEPTLTYNGVPINHQYSKSSEFETDYQKVLVADFSDTIRYYSLLRPLSEIQIAKYFTVTGFEKYHDVFSSCNKAFVHGSHKVFWDGTCPKCAFMYLVLGMYLNEEAITSLIGHNLLLDPNLESTYRQLLGIDSEKPLECVGEIAESRWAMNIMKQKYPELEKYTYVSVTDKEIFYLGPDTMPNEIRTLVNPIFEQT